MVGEIPARQFTNADNCLRLTPSPHCRFGDGQSQRLDAVVQHGEPGVRRVPSGHCWYLLSESQPKSVVVNQIHVHDAAILGETKDETPVAGTHERPHHPAIEPFSGWRAKPGSPISVGFRRDVQTIQPAFEPRQEFRRKTPTVAFSVEAFQTPVAERLDHSWAPARFSWGRGSHFIPSASSQSECNLSRGRVQSRFDPGNGKSGLVNQAA